MINTTRRKNSNKTKKQQFLTENGLKLINLNNDIYYWNKVTNQLYQEIEYTFSTIEHFNEKDYATRHFKHNVGKKYQAFLKEFKNIEERERES